MFLDNLTEIYKRELTEWYSFVLRGQKPPHPLCPRNFPYTPHKPLGFFSICVCVRVECVKICSSPGHLTPTKHSSLNLRGRNFFFCAFLFVFLLPTALINSSGIRREVDGLVGTAVRQTDTGRRRQRQGNMHNN